MVRMLHGGGKQDRSQLIHRCFTGHYTLICRGKMESEETSRPECVGDSLDFSKYAFGKFQETTNWVECESRSYPNRTYFFNLRSLCSTWTRPVSRHIKLQRFPNVKLQNQIVTDDIDNQPIMIVSSESEDDGKSNFRKSKKEIFAWLYHGVDIHDRINDDQTNCTNSLVPDTMNEQDSLLANESAFYEIGYHFVASNDCDKIQISKAALEDVTNTLDFLEVNFSTSDNATEIVGNNRQPTADDNNDDSSIVEKCIAYSTSSSEGCGSRELVENYYAPRLQKIRSKHLLKEKRGTKRKGGVSQVKRIRKKPRKIVSGMCGTTTINRDPLELNMPPDVKVTNLSDSSTSTFICRNATPSVPAKTRFPDIVIGEVNLSSDSSSSSSCTSCSSCSTSSDSSETTSESTSGIVSKTIER
nr:uncharacterized protein LOC117227532 [Megalopta genalis]